LPADDLSVENGLLVTRGVDEVGGGFWQPFSFGKKDVTNIRKT